ncbi:MAG: D-2-hydroxyacid dehydrogenase [Actinomycetota bacterium]|nr:D-2-hydroxyacid dehydrogenase [Actinomycetota bacterium]
MLRLVMLPPQSDLTRSWAERLRMDVPSLDVQVAESVEDVAASIATADAAYGTLSPAHLASAGLLRWLQAPAAAPDAGYFSEELIAHPVTVTNLRGIYNDHVATHAVALVLALARGIHRTILDQRSHVWSPYREPDASIYLPEATVLVIGLGGIGNEIARLMNAFGCRVVATDARVSEPPPYVVEVANPDELDRLLPDADIVVLTVPHTPETEGLFDAERFGMMKPSAVLVNIGRGMTVRLDALVDALESGTIAGAGLDVFEIEPLPEDHPLWDAPNVVLTPHVAVEGPYTDERRYGVLLENARRFVSGEPLINVVDKEHWF